MRSWKAAVMHHQTRNSTSLSRSPRPKDGRSVSSGALTFRLARGNVPRVDAMPRVGGGKKGMKRLFAVAASVAVLVCGGASAAFAGEVTGPPNQVNNTNETGALDHANSICAASGLNDFDLSDPMGRPCRRFRPRRTLGSTTASRRALPVRSDSAGAEPGKGESQRSPRRSVGARAALGFFRKP